MADWEQKLITKILTGHDIREVDEGNITLKHFEDPEHHRVFKWIKEEQRSERGLPTLDYFKDHFRDYQLSSNTDESMAAIMERLRNAHGLAVLAPAINEAVKHHDDNDFSTTLQILLKATKEAAEEASPSRDLNANDAPDNRLAEYRKRKNSGDEILGIPSGFKTIDEATMGFQPKQLCTYVGAPKAGKSTAMLYSAMHANNEGFAPLFIGFEMTNEEQLLRLDSMISGVPMDRIKRGQMTEADEKNLAKAMSVSRELSPFWFSSDISSVTTVSGVGAKIARHKPDIVFVDGVYLMDDEQGEPKMSWQALTNITQGFKRLAQNMEVPIVISTQVLLSKMEKGRITGSSIGYSSSFLQDSDVIIAIEREPAKIKIVASRNCEPKESFLNWDWGAVKFEEIQTTSAEEGGW